MDNIITAIARKFLLDNKAGRGNKSANRAAMNLKALWNWHKDTVLRILGGHSPFCRRRVHQARSHPMRCQQSTGRCRTVAENLLNTLLHTGARTGKSSSFVGQMCPATAYCYGLKSGKGSAKQSRRAPITPTLKPYWTLKTGDW